MEDPVEVQPPAGNRLFIVLRVEMSGDYASFAPLDDTPLNLGHSPTFESSVSALPGMSTADPTHVVNCSIASNTD